MRIRNAFRSVCSVLLVAVQIISGNERERVLTFKTVGLNNALFEQLNQFRRLVSTVQEEEEEEEYRATDGT